ncbi:helix-turn-helix domain-containing protein [Polymorphobacter sp.]|uniref:helix-turn-helix domain-containing protein n=1 Tax=Polymorphobacter sp. TaxID=1909290 RepID=UPI003F72C25D
MRKSAVNIDKSHNNPISRNEASEKSRTAWGARIEEALGARSKAWLAREAGITSSTLNDIIARTKMEAGNALRLAQALDVPLEWLISGELAKTGHGLVAADEADWVMVPHFRLAEFTETGKPEPWATTPIRKDWLNRTLYTSTNLFITELPAHQLEGLGEEGDPILCRDAQHHQEEGFYLYFWDGTPLVRRFTGPPLQQLGEVQRSWQWEPDDPSSLRIAGRILANLKVRPV